MTENGKCNNLKPISKDNPYTLITITTTKGESYSVQIYDEKDLEKIPQAIAAALIKSEIYCEVVKK